MTEFGRLESKDLRDAWLQKRCTANRFPIRLLIPLTKRRRDTKASRCLLTWETGLPLPRLCNCNETAKEGATAEGRPDRPTEALAKKSLLPVRVASRLKTYLIKTKPPRLPRLPRRWKRLRPHPAQ